MRIAVVGATGNLGRRVVRQALEAGHEVRAFVRSAARTEGLPGDAEVIERDLFAIEAADLTGCDALVSAFGSGFSADPAANEKACARYLELGRAAGVRVVAVVGSGCLFADETRTQRVYELPGHPSKLVEISAAATRGLGLLDAAVDVDWCLVTPGLTFDSEGPLNPAAAVTFDASRVVTRNAAGSSYSTYEDVAAAMLTLAETGEYAHELVQITSPQ